MVIERSEYIPWLTGYLTGTFIFSVTADLEIAILGPALRCLSDFINTHGHRIYPAAAWMAALFISCLFQIPGYTFDL